MLLVGSLHSGDPVAAAAQSDAATAYNNLAGQPCDVDLTGQDLGTLTLTPGTYCFNYSAPLSGTLTLTGAGVFVFRIGSTLITSAESLVRLTSANSCAASNVFWQVGSSATIGVSSTIAGNILALTSITLNYNATVTGRALALQAAVTMDTNSVRPECTMTTEPATTTTTTTTTTTQAPMTTPATTKEKTHKEKTDKEKTHKEKTDKEKTDKRSTTTPAPTKKQKTDKKKV